MACEVKKWRYFEEKMFRVGVGVKSGMGMARVRTKKKKNLHIK